MQNKEFKIIKNDLNNMLQTNQFYDYMLTHSYNYLLTDCAQLSFNSMRSKISFYSSLKLFLLIAGLLASRLSFAQFNDSTHYYTSFVSSGSINETNDGTTYLLNNVLKFNIKQKNSSLNFTNSWIYGKQNNALTNNDFSSSLFFNLYSPIKHFYYWGMANYNTSYSLKINNELLTGAGVAYSIYDRKNVYVNLSDGLLYDQSDLILSNNVRDVYHTYRNSLRLSFRFDIKDRIIIDGSDFLQNSLDRRSDYIIRTTTNLSFKLNKWLSLTSSLNYNRQNRTQSDNLLFTYGLTVEKYF
jgi:hypothetical protein